AGPASNLGCRHAWPVSSSQLSELMMTDSGKSVDDDSLADIAYIICSNRALVHVIVYVPHTIKALVTLIDAMMARDTPLDGLCLQAVVHSPDDVADGRRGSSRS
ncbi:hypothetical protein As57867_007254, partial [Aphanomyces stellatus]